MHSRSNSSAEATIKRVQGPKLDFLSIYFVGVPKDKVKIKVFQGDKLSTSLTGRRPSALRALRVTMRLHDTEQEAETPQFTVSVAVLLVTVPALLLTTTANVA